MRIRKLEQNRLECLVARYSAVSECPVANTQFLVYSLIAGELQAKI